MDNNNINYLNKKEPFPTDYNYLETSCNSTQLVDDNTMKLIYRYKSHLQSTDIIFIYSPSIPLSQEIKSKSNISYNSDTKVIKNDINSTNKYKNAILPRLSALGVQSYNNNINDNQPIQMLVFSIDILAERTSFKLLILYELTNIIRAINVYLVDTLNPNNMIRCFINYNINSSYFKYSTFQFTRSLIGHYNVTQDSAEHISDDLHAMIEFSDNIQTNQIKNSIFCLHVSALDDNGIVSPCSVSPTSSIEMIAQMLSDNFCENNIGRLSQCFFAIKCLLDNGIYGHPHSFVEMDNIWDDYYHLMSIHLSNTSDNYYIHAIFSEVNAANNNISHSNIDINEQLYTMHRCCIYPYLTTIPIFSNPHPITNSAANNKSSQSKRTSNNSNNKNEENRSGQGNNNNNNNNNNNIGITSTGDGDGDSDDDKDNDKNKKIRVNDDIESDATNKEENEDENDEDDEDDDDEKKEQKQDIKLNVNAPQFIPKKPVKFILDTIDEDEKEEKESKPMKFQRAKFDAMPIKCAGTIEIPRDLTETIIPSTVKEDISNIYYFMDKSMALLSNKKMLKNQRFVVINYDFHDMVTDEILYCIIQKQDPSKHGGFSWIMMDRLFTTKEIYIKFNISESDLILPTSSRYESKIIEQMDYTHQIYDILQTQLILAIIERTQWHRIPVYKRTNNKQRKVSYLTKKEFMKRLEYFITNTKNINVIPIMIQNSNKEYWIEHIFITKIDENIHIGISMKYKPYRNRIEATGIHLDKEYILNKHQLAAPNHYCHCLDDFESYIDEIAIGNIDEDKNRIKDLQKRHEINKNENDRIKNENTNLKKKVSFYKKRYFQLKKFVKRFSSQKVPINQLLTEAKDHLNEDDDDDDDIDLSPIPTVQTVETQSIGTNTDNLAAFIPSTITPFPIPITASYPIQPAIPPSIPSIPSIPTVPIPLYSPMLQQTSSIYSIQSIGSPASSAALPYPSMSVSTVQPVNYQQDEIQSTMTENQSTKLNTDSNKES